MATDILRHALLFASPAEESPRSERTPPRRQAPSTTVTNVEALGAAIHIGDRNAFDHMFMALHGELWHFARSIVRDGDVANDVVQDVFIDVWDRHDTWAPHGSIRGYFFGAVRNRALHITRSMAARERTTQRFAADRDIATPSAIAPDQSSDTDDIVTILRRAIDALPERQRSAMLLRWNTELNATDIGRALGISDTAARKLLAKGEATLRQLYDRLTRA